MAKKKPTRLQELQDYARSAGLHVATWSPGDGTTRYRFFDKPQLVLRARQRHLHRARPQGRVELPLRLRGGALNPMSLYKDLVRAKIPTDHHESDLYVLDTPRARELIAKHKQKGESFTSRVDGLRWIDVPFAYDPFWEKKAR